MSRLVQWSSQFKKDYKNAIRRGLQIEELDDVIRKLAEDIPLPPQMKDHALTGNYYNFRECHIKPDWLLIYAKDDRVLTLTLSRTGTHSDLF